MLNSYFGGQKLYSARQARKTPKKLFQQSIFKAVTLESTIGLNKTIVSCVIMSSIINTALKYVFEDIHALLSGCGLRHFSRLHQLFNYRNDQSTYCRALYLQPLPELRIWVYEKPSL
jgi:hypothetical protein